jgi:hypothetical protein
MMTMIASPSSAVSVPPVSLHSRFQAAQAAELPDLHAVCSGQTCPTQRLITVYMCCDVGDRDALHEFYELLLLSAAVFDNLMLP